jgi:hypothetical protein
MCKSRTAVRLGKFRLVRRTWFCRCSNFSRYLSAANPQAGQACVMIFLMSALWKGRLMLVLNRPHLNRGYIIINVWMPWLRSILCAISMYLSYQRLYRDILRYLQRNISSIHGKMGPRWSTTARKVNRLSLIFMYVNIPAPTTGLYWAETTLQFSDNKILLSICRVQTSAVGKKRAT